MTDMKYEMPEVNQKYIKVVAHKVNGINEFQPDTVVDGDKCYRTSHIKVTNLKEGEDKNGKYIYFGYVPVGKSIGSFRFGYDKVYLNGNPFEYGIVGLEKM